jgi:hypothetical protein
LAASTKDLKEAEAEKRQKAEAVAQKIDSKEEKWDTEKAR